MSITAIKAKLLTHTWCLSVEVESSVAVEDEPSPRRRVIALFPASKLAEENRESLRIAKLLVKVINDQ